MGKDKQSAPTLFVGGPVRQASGRTPCCATFRRKFRMSGGQALRACAMGSGPGTSSIRPTAEEFRRRPLTYPLGG